MQSFHATVEHVAGKWVRRNREMPEPELGATLPVWAYVYTCLSYFIFSEQA